MEMHQTQLKIKHAGMQQALISNTHLLFSGLDTSVLNGLMTNGSSAGVSSTTSPDQETNNFYMALVAISLPIAWAGTGVSGSGFFWMTGKGLGDVNGDTDVTTCNGATNAASSIFNTMDFTNADDAFACDTATNTPYWLAYIGRTCTKDVGHVGGWYCGDNHIVYGPPGVANINGKNFGGLTLTNLLKRYLFFFFLAYTPFPPWTPLLGPVCSFYFGSGV